MAKYKNVGRVYKTRHGAVGRALKVKKAGKDWRIRSIKTTGYQVQSKAKLKRRR